MPKKFSTNNKELGSVIKCSYFYSESEYVTIAVMTWKRETRKSELAEVKRRPHVYKIPIYDL
jgi:hypothetical protein